MQDEARTNAEQSLSICPLFESELLTELMLRYWDHPLADQADFREQLLEAATDVLRSAVEAPMGNVFIQGLPSREMNLVAAIWYVEHCAIEDAQNEGERGIEERLRWLGAVRRALPSCFCDPTDLS